LNPISVLLMERRVQNTSILCKNNCGFYGNPSWANYCSRCYREEYLRQSASKTAVSALSQVSSPAFSKFEAKRKKVADKSSSTVKSILKITRDSQNSTSHLPDEAAQAQKEFNRVLQKWKQAATADIWRQVTNLLNLLDTLRQSDITEFSMAVQKFYTSISNRIYKHQFYNDASTEQKEELINAIERFLTVWIHPFAFAPRTTDDEEIDLKLQDKIRSLHWVGHASLEAPIDPSSPDQSLHLESAILALININAVPSTEAKLDQVVLCCREIFEALNLNAISTTEANKRSAPSLNTPSEGSAANTDDFLPALIWVVLRANPPLLHSNLQFVIRFANGTHLNTGEAAYFFTNLCCAVTFITDLTHASLGMSKEEFDSQMRDGVSVTLCPVEIPGALFENESRYQRIGEKIKDLETQMLSGERDLQCAHEDLMNRISELRTTYPVKRTVFLDPRELDSPHVLCLGPPEKPAASTSAAATAETASTAPAPPLPPQQSLLDVLPTEDVQTPCLLPSTIE
uniref:VPS9 domain-containing protein n=1 Tax=Schistocephalus solidus TaxID=70667 RepID=A0A183S928_SCHSO